jgi:hypothetical protein
MSERVGKRPAYTDDLWHRANAALASARRKEMSDGSIFAVAGRNSRLSGGDKTDQKDPAFKV